MHQTDQLAVLARQLVRVRRSLEAESPYGPAWAATSEWVDDLEREIRDLRVERAVVGSTILSERSDRQRVA